MFLAGAGEAAFEATPIPGIGAATESVVAVDRGERILKTHLREYIRTIQQVFEVRTFYGYAGPRKAMQSLLLNQRLAKEARQGEVLPDNWDEATELIRKRLLVLMVQERAAVGEISDATLQQYYGDHPEYFREPDRLTFRHIFLEVPPGAAEEKWEETRRRILQLRERVLEGEDFAELARQYSEVPSGEKGGLVEKVAARDIRVEEFVDVAFQLKPEQLSEPIRTRYGYHLVRVKEVHPGETRPFEDVLRQGRLRQWMVREHLSGRLQVIVSEMSELWPVEKHFEALTGLEEATPGTVLFSVGNGTFTVGDLRNELVPLPDLRDAGQRKWLEDHLQGIIHAELIRRYAVQQGLDLTEEFQRRFSYAEDYLLAQQYLLFQTDHSPRLGKEELQEYYQANRGRFRSKRSIEASQILCLAQVTPDMLKGERFRRMRAARQRAEAIRERLLAGENFAQVARQESDDALAERGGSLGRITYGSMPAPFEVVAYSLEPGEISEAVELKDGYVIVRVEKKYPTRQLTFEEAKPQIVDFLRSQIYQRLSDEAWDSVAQSSEVRVFDERVQEVWN